MPTNFPSTLDTYTAKVNSVDVVAASNVNNLQDAVLAVENALGAPMFRGAELTTWTPGVSFATAPTGLTYASSPTNFGQVGFYARFGGIIWFTGVFNLTSRGTGGSGNATITGLPVASANSSLFHYHPCISTNANMTTTFPALMRVNPNATTAGIFGWSSTAAISAITYANFTDSSFLSFTGWYFHA